MNVTLPSGANWGCMSIWLYAGSSCRSSALCSNKLDVRSLFSRLHDLLPSEFILGNAGLLIDRVRPKATELLSVVFVDGTGPILEGLKTLNS